MFAGNRNEGTRFPTAADRLTRLRKVFRASAHRFQGGTAAARLRRGDNVDLEDLEATEPEDVEINVQLRRMSSRQGMRRMSSGVARRPSHTRPDEGRLASHGSRAADDAMEREPTENDSLRGSDAAGAAGKFMDLLLPMNRKRPLSSHAMASRNRNKVPHTEVNQVVEAFHNGIDNVEVIGREFDIPEDAYGAAILAIVKEREILQQKSFDHLAAFRMGLCIFLLAINLVLQFFLLRFMQVKVVLPAVNHVQAMYKEFHAAVFDPDGSFRPDLWHLYPGKNELCQISMTSFTLFSMVIFFWTCQMVKEFATTESLFWDIYLMPILDKKDHKSAMIVTLDSGLEAIVALTESARLLIFFTVCLPKACISVYLLVLGYQLLSATTSFENLVMNTVSMEFVLHADELLYEAYFPRSYKDQVEKINFFVKEPAQTADEVEWDEWRSYFRAITYLAFCFVAVYIWMFFEQDVLPHDLTDVRRSCTEYLEEMRPLCPSGDFRKCYPWGNSTSAENGFTSAYG